MKKEDKLELELKMYGLVSDQLSDIQKGVQFSHALVEYNLQHGMSELYLNWAQNWRGVKLLNGGTTNDNPKWLGTLNKYAKDLAEMNIPISSFHNPELGDQVTAIVFIVDERVYNLEKYPKPILPKRHKNNSVFTTKQDDEILENFIKTIGGYTNYKLREFLTPLKTV